MSAAAAQAPTVKITERRQSSRRPLAVPMEVSLLRSGIPDRVPGRMLNLGEGGLAMIAAAELRNGDFVGLEFRLSNSSAPVIVKARVRHQALLRYGLEFLNVSEEQQTHIRYCFERKAAPAAQSLLSLAEIPRIELEAPEALPAAHSFPVPPRRSAAVRWLWVALAAFLLVGGLGWWRWYQAWSELESRLASGQTRVYTPTPFAVSEDTAMRLLIHRVDPFYPDDARLDIGPGTVILDVIINADGTVRDAHAISGPTLLASSAIDAVKLWRFQPYPLNGRLVPLETTLHIELQP